MKTRITLILCCVLLAGCAHSTTQPVNVVPSETSSSQPTLAGMPNPASVYCEQQGNKVDIRTAADGSQSGVCIFPDGSECDEWAFYRGECGPASKPDSSPTPAVDIATSAPTEIATPLPLNPADYQGWWTYTNATYGFSLLLSPDWVGDETTGDPLMNGHELILHPQDANTHLSIRVTFRRLGEEVLLWPTGVGSGEFVPQGTLDVAGQPMRRVLFVCPTGQVNSIWYQQSETEANIRRGDLEFGFIFGYDQIYCQEGYSLGGKVQLVGEMIIASLKVP